MKYKHAKQLRSLIEHSTAALTDEEALTGIELFPRWKTDTEYITDDRISYNGLLYRCLQNHTSQASWTPSEAVSLWVRIDDPSEEFPEWKQPLGSHDAYSLGAKVSHLEKHWISIIDANIYEPSVYGWDEV